jgi:hypothetical protein
MPILGAASTTDGVEPLIPALEGVTYWIFGHSYFATAGADSSHQRTGADRFGIRHRMIPPVQEAVAGNTMAQTLGNIVSTWQPNGLGLVALCSQINDVNSGVDPAATAEAFRSCLAYLTAQAVLAANSTSFIYDANWTNGTTSTTGAYVDFAWSGDTAHLLVAFTNGTGSTGQILNSGTGSTVAQTFQTGGTGAWANSRTFTGAIRLSGYGAGNHTVRVKLASGSSLTIVGAAVMSPAPPTILWVREGQLSSYSSAQNTILTVTMPTALATVAATFPTVVTAIPDAGYDPATMLEAAGVHPNSKGREYFASLMTKAMLGTTFRHGLNDMNGGSNSGTQVTSYTPVTPSFVA